MTNLLWQCCVIWSSCDRHVTIHVHHYLPTVSVSPTSWIPQYSCAWVLSPPWDRWLQWAVWMGKTRPRSDQKVYNNNTWLCRTSVFLIATLKNWEWSGDEATWYIAILAHFYALLDFIVLIQIYIQTLFFLNFHLESFGMPIALENVISTLLFFSSLCIAIKFIIVPSQKGSLLRRWVGPKRRWTRYCYQCWREWTQGSLRDSRRSPSSFPPSLPLHPLSLAL